MENVKEIPIAEHLYDYTFDGLNIEDNEHLIPEIMIEFAKLHVEAALKAASIKIKLDALENFGTEAPDCWNEESIINAYPLDLIK